MDAGKAAAARLRLTPLFDHTPGWVYALAILPPAAILAVLCAQPFVPPATLMRDTVAVLDGRFYDGLASNLGALGWCAAAAVCLFRGAELRANNPGDPDARFLLAAGALTTLLTLDDLFLIHEEVMPVYLRVPERIYLAGYLAALGLYLAVGWRHILRADAPILALALGFFALSVAVDQLRELRIYAGMTDDDQTLAWIAEDGAKLMGIAAWLVFHVRAAWGAGMPLRLATDGGRAPRG